MSKYTSVKNRAWFTECYKQEYANEDIDQDDIASVELVNTYTLD